MLHKKLIFFFFILIVSYFGESQSQKNIPEGYFKNPLDIELKLSGTFGELRSNHFHSGLDIKTNQRTGLKVYATASGYVSRIKIERYGYGKAIYITHPNGYTSVYAHLDKLSPRIEEYLKKQQYDKETFEIQLFPSDLELRVDQGEVIAYSGNSGGSGGPHLHFEIRDSAARPINPMMMGIQVPDTKKPLVKQIMAYPLDENTTINGKNEPALLRLIPLKSGGFKTENLKAYGTIGIGVNTSDRQNGGNNQNGVYQITTSYNGTPNFEICFDTYAFKETRYLNQMIDYGFFKKNKSRISKLFIPSGSPLSLYGNSINDGKLSLYDPGSHSNYQIEIKDYQGNTSKIIMDIINDEAPAELLAPNNDGLEYVSHTSTFNRQLGNFNLTIPKGALYEDQLLEIKENLDTIIVHRDVVPLHKNFILEYDISSKVGDNLDQYYIARITSWGAAYHVNTKRNGNKLTAYSKIMGTYAITKDDKKPSIKPINFKNKQWISKNKTLRLSIADKESGIDGYRATVNGKFILMEYDYKTGIIKHDFSDNVVIDSENHLKVIVTDNAGNSTTFEATFFRKI
ncbi:M23 family metallopeptidase [Nonlabens mediterrranea]|uniref:M23 family metallopeptidase n=1 Tax=Nonlabens mediterrranea TaxID=1419947 RepID=A0ABS0A2E4_9FLAO|nr:M23 family metallopeptidase [Nonlabens mediterrranea]